MGSIDYILVEVAPHANAYPMQELNPCSVLHQPSERNGRETAQDTVNGGTGLEPFASGVVE